MASPAIMRGHGRTWHIFPEPALRMGIGQVSGNQHFRVGVKLLPGDEHYRNVLGTKTYHNNYEASPTTGSSNCNTSIYQIAWASSQCRSGSGNDSLTISTLLRWGNYDVAHASAQWNASEIPTTGVPFINGNPVPATHTLPSSFYLTTKPSGGARCRGLRSARM